MGEDHRLAGGGFGFVVAGESAGLHEPAEGAFDDPTLVLDGEAFGCGVAALDDVQAQGGMGGVRAQVARRTRRLRGPQSCTSRGWVRGTGGSTFKALARSETSALVTTTPRINPRVSATRCRFRTPGWLRFFVRHPELSTPFLQFARAIKSLKSRLFTQSLSPVPFPAARSATA